MLTSIPKTMRGTESAAAEPCLLRFAAPTVLPPVLVLVRNLPV